MFVKPNLYVRLTPLVLTLTNGKEARAFNSGKWHFQPTGRVFVRAETFPQGRRYDPARLQGQIAMYWGRYRVEPGEAGAALEPSV